MAMFPDSGVPRADAKNSIDANTVAGCDELWYSTSRCQPRFDPAAANAMLSEILNAINCAGIPYDCNRLDNLCTAIAYTIQNGDSNCLYLAGGQFDYTGGLHPPLLAYPSDCCMMLKAIPNVDNQGAVRINIDNHGWVPVVRNDGLPLKAKDIKAGIPFLIIYCGGRFIVPGLLPSQVPIVATGGVDGWIRTDGNDILGDGTANTPDKAFRTISGAWAALGGRYAASPLFSINLRLGIPGNYEGAYFGPFGGQVTLTGDPNNRAVYRVMAANMGGVAACLLLRCASMSLSGCNFVMADPAVYSNGNWCVRASASLVADHCQFTLEASTGNGTCPIALEGGSMVCVNDSIIEGNGLSCGSGVSIWAGGAWGGCPPGNPVSVWTWRNMNFLSCGHYVNNGECLWGNMALPYTGCTGPKYGVHRNGNSRQGRP